MIDKSKALSFRPQVDSLYEKKQTSEEKIKEVADLYEKQFMREMLKQMRATVSESGFIKTNQAEKIFREQLDDHYTDQWSQQGGIGMSTIIYDQLVEKFGAQLGIANKKSALSPVDGPVSLKNNNLPLNLNADSISKLQARVVDHQTSEASSAFVLDLSDINGKLPEVHSPWSGTLIDKLDVGPDQHWLRIEHDNGLKSDLNFHGRVVVEKGQTLKSGQALGLLNPDQSQLFWGVKKIISE